MTDEEVQEMRKDLKRAADACTQKLSTGALSIFWEGYYSGKLIGLNRALRGLEGKP